MSAALVDALSVAWREELLAGQRAPSGPRDYCYASVRRSCVRRMALDLMHPEDEPPWSPESLERARRGQDRERAIVALLGHVGQRCTPRFSVIEQQRRYEVRDRDGELLIVGKVDGRLKFEGAPDVPVFDVKSGDSIRNVDTLEDLDRSPWTAHYLDQLLTYLLAESEPWGMLILDKPDGPTFLRVDLCEHLDRAESFLRDARTAVDARFERAPLPSYTTDRAECRRCPHLGKSCSPNLDFGAGVRVIDDESLIALAQLREAHAESAKVYERADKTLKEKLRGVELGLLGEYTVTGKWQGANKYDVPDDVKQQYQTFDPHARFMLKIERAK